MTRLAEAHVEQIKTLRAEGKTAPEIVKTMEQTYPGVKFAPYHVYSVIKKDKKVMGGGEAKVKRQYKKRADKITDAGVSDPGKVVKDIVALLAEVNAGYGRVFAYLRTELIKSRAEVCLMLTGAGLEPAKSDIE